MIPAPRTRIRPRLVLASSSPRRAAILRRAGFVFEIHPPAVAETLFEGEPADHAVVRIALDKAAAIASNHGDAVVLGLDTAVVIDGEMLGKPGTETDAVAMLRKLSGRTHEAITGFAALVSGAIAEAGVESTAIEMRTISPEAAASYAATGDPLDKAGGYAIQGDAGRFIARISGSRSNVMGLPLERIFPLLHRLGVAGH